MEENVMKRHPIRVAGTIMGAALLIGVAAAPLGAESYPSKPIRFIVGNAPGGGSDLLARIISPKLGERLGQPVVIEYRPGAGGSLGTELAVKAPPDGYTILITQSAIVTGPSLNKKLSYDPLRDLAPISLVAETRLALFVRSSLPVNSLKDFVEYARANPGKLNFGSSGIGAGTHLAGELLKSLTKISMSHVAYKSAGAALIAMMNGEIDMQITPLGVAMPGIEAGKLKPLAVLSHERTPSFPHVPTAKESGVDNFVVTSWFGILTSARTPRDIVNRLNAEWTRIAAMPDTKAKMQKIDFEPISVTPEQFSDFLKAEFGRWAKVIREANLSID